MVAIWTRNAVSMVEIWWKSLLNILVFYGFLVFLAWLGTFSFILIFCWGIRHPWSTPHRDEQGELAAVFFVRRSSRLWPMVMLNTCTYGCVYLFNWYLNTLFCTYGYICSIFLYTYGYIYIFNEPCSEISGLVSDHKNSLTRSNPERESRSSIGIWFVGTNVHSSNNGIYFLYKAGPPSYKMFQLQIYPHTISMNRSIFLLDDWI